MIQISAKNFLEAIQLYMDKLRPDGLLVIHTSHSYVHLRPVLAAAARDLKLEIRAADDLTVTEDEKAKGKNISTWVMLARESAHFGKFSNHWNVPTVPTQRAWTDHYSNLLGAISINR